MDDFLFFFHLYDRIITLCTEYKTSVIRFKKGLLIHIWQMIDFEILKVVSDNPSNIFNIGFRGNDPIRV